MCLYATSKWQRRIHVRSPGQSLPQTYDSSAVRQTSLRQYVTPADKAMLRRKNQLMRVGRVDDAGTLPARVCHHMEQFSVVT